MNAMRWINRLAHFTDSVELLYYGQKSKRRWQPHPARFSKEIALDEIAVRLAAGEFDLFVNIAVNPAVTYADSNLWVHALNRTPTLVVDTNMTTTATYADFFLKVGGMFAQADFQNSYFFSHHYSRPAFTDELSDMQAARALAKKLEISLISTTEEELRAPAPAPRQYRTTTLDLHWPQQMKDFRLLTASHLDYLNSQIINGQEQGLQVIHINPIDAEQRDINSDDTLRVEGDCGAFSAQALITDEVPEGTLMCWKNLPMLDGFCNSAVPGRLTDGENGLAYYAAEVRIFKITT
jgi:anaerobic selenocysteine-containing dehydrogenase